MNSTPGTTTGPAGGWLIMGAGLCVVSLGTVAFTIWQQRRSRIRP